MKQVGNFWMQPANPNASVIISVCYSESVRQSDFASDASYSIDSWFESQLSERMIQTKITLDRERNKL